MATFNISDPNTPAGVPVELLYNLFLSNTWSCIAHGMLSVDGGEWTCNSFTRIIYLNDYSGNMIVKMTGVPIHSLGYPFDPADNGTTGSKKCAIVSPASGGVGVGYPACDWTLVAA